MHLKVLINAASGKSVKVLRNFDMRALLVIWFTSVVYCMYTARDEVIQLTPKNFKQVVRETMVLFLD
jgi:hypothetical protein